MNGLTETNSAAPCPCCSQTVKVGPRPVCGCVMPVCLECGKCKPHCRCESFADLTNVMQEAMKVLD